MGLERTISCLLQTDYPFLARLLQGGLEEPDWAVRLAIFRIALEKKLWPVLRQFFETEIPETTLEEILHILKSYDEAFLNTVMTHSLEELSPPGVLTLTRLLSHMDYPWCLTLLLYLMERTKEREPAGGTSPEEGDIFLPQVIHSIGQYVQRRASQIKSEELHFSAGDPKGQPLKELAQHLSKTLQNYRGEKEILIWLLQLGRNGFEYVLPILFDPKSRAFSDLAWILSHPSEVSSPEIDALPFQNKTSSGDLAVPLEEALIEFYVYAQNAGLDMEPRKRLDDLLPDRVDTPLGGAFLNFLDRHPSLDNRSLYQPFHHIPFERAIDNALKVSLSQGKEIFSRNFFNLFSFVLEAHLKIEEKGSKLESLSALVYPVVSSLLFLPADRLAELVKSLMDCLNPAPYQWLSLFFLEVLPRSSLPDSVQQEYVRSIGERTSFPEIQAKTSAFMAHHVFEQFYDRFNDLPSQTRQHIGQAVLKGDPKILVQLEQDLTHLDPQARFKALYLLSLSEQKTELRKHIQTLLMDPYGQVRALAVLLLNLLDEKTMHEVVRGAFHDPDPRVRANAVEAYAPYLQSDQDPDFLPLLMDAHNRVQANAIKALFRVNPSRARLLLDQMLQSTQDSKRRSAIWLIGEMELDEKRPLLKDMEVSDRSMDVRRRAQKTLRKLALKTVKKL